MTVSIPCPACRGEIRATDEFCEGCGATVTADQKRSIRDRLEACGGDGAEQMKLVRAAQQTIMMLAVLFVFGGLVMFVLSKVQAMEALDKLRDLRPERMLSQPIDGKLLSVREARELIENEPIKVLGVNLFLAAVMAGLWAWGKKATLAAILVALAVFVAVHVGSALVNPLTLLQGVLVKIIAVVLLIRGIRAALAVRKLERPERA